MSQHTALPELHQRTSLRAVTIPSVPVRWRSGGPFDDLSHAWPDVAGHRPPVCVLARSAWNPSYLPPSELCPSCERATGTDFVIAGGHVYDDRKITDRPLCGTRPDVCPPVTGRPEPGTDPYRQRCGPCSTYLTRHRHDVELARVPDPYWPEHTGHVISPRNPARLVCGALVDRPAPPVVPAATCGVCISALNAIAQWRSHFLRHLPTGAELVRDALRTGATAHPRSAHDRCPLKQEPTS